MTPNSAEPAATAHAPGNRASPETRKQADVTAMLLGWTALGCAFAAVTTLLALLGWLFP